MLIDYVTSYLMQVRGNTKRVRPLKVLHFGTDCKAVLWMAAMCTLHVDPQRSRSGLRGDAFCVERVQCAGSDGTTGIVTFREGGAP